MCEALDRVENRGLQKGLQKGIGEFISICRKFNMSDKKICLEIKGRFRVTKAQADRFMMKYIDFKNYEQGFYKKHKRMDARTMYELLEGVNNQGWEDGWEEGLQEGRKEGLTKAKVTDLKNLMKTLQLTLKQAMNALKIPKRERAMFEKMIRN